MIKQACFAVLLFAAQCHALAPGQTAPGVSLQGLDGKTHALADYKGQVVLVDFWASWCGPCRQSFPFLNRMQSTYGAAGFKVVGINVDEKRADADRFLTKVPASFDLWFDPQGVAPKAFDVKVMPSSYLIDAEGKIIHVHLGYKLADAAKVETLIRNATVGNKK
jgi:cytochrome c biogenesis protein CcmG, thiol:disulfide interchange protein DsbE